MLAGGLPTFWTRARGGAGDSLRRLRRALEVGRIARGGKLLRVLGEIGVVGDRTATREGAQELRRTLEELGTAYVKLGQLLSSRSDLLPDVYIEELSRLVDEVAPTPFAELEPIIREDLGDVFARIDSGGAGRRDRRARRIPRLGGPRPLLVVEGDQDAGRAVVSAR